MPLLKDGKLVALAVGAPSARSHWPSFPTTLEAGVPNSDLQLLVGCSHRRRRRARSGAVSIRRLQGLRAADVREKRRAGRRADGLQPELSTPTSATRSGGDAALVKEAGIKLE